MNSHRRVGATMYVLAGILTLGLLTLLFDDMLEQQRNPNPRPETVSDGDGMMSLTLVRNRAGHYVLNGTINGMVVEFLIDTGASEVAIPADLAQRLGLARGAPKQVMTASGFARVYTTSIAELSIGGIVERDVHASIIPAMPGSQVLLGMSFLKRLDFSQRDDTLILTQRASR